MDQKRSYFSHQHPNTLPIFQLLAFSVTGFIAIMTETIPAGLLQLISRDFGISQAMAGQMVSVYAAGSVIAAIPIVTTTRHWSRKSLFLCALGGLFIFNTITALCSNYSILLIARFIAGMSAGIIWGILAGYARNLVQPNLQGRALAIVGIGQPIALCMGVPFGTWLGNLFGWRGVFGVISLLTLSVMIWILTTIPNSSYSCSKKRKSIQEIFFSPGIRTILGIILLWILAHNILYTFISSYLISSGFGNHIDLILLLFGISAIFGIWITGIWIDSALRLLTIASLAGFCIAAIFIGLGLSNSYFLIFGTILWGITFGGAPTILQTAIADIAGEEADVAQSMLVTVFNLAVAGGGVFGAVLLEKFGLNTLPFTMLLLAFLSIIIVFQAKNYGSKFNNKNI